MNWLPDDLLQGLLIAIAVMLIVVLYHILFIVVDMRKVMRRVERITGEIEAVILKPLSLTDQAVEWMMEFFKNKTKKQMHKK